MDINFTNINNAHGGQNIINKNMYKTRISDLRLRSLLNMKTLEVFLGSQKQIMEGSVLTVPAYPYNLLEKKTNQSAIVKNIFVKWC